MKRIISLRFCDTNLSLNTGCLDNFADPADCSMKIKECKNMDKYLDLAQELRKLWNMQVTVISIVVGAFGTAAKGLKKG